MGRPKEYRELRTFLFVVCEMAMQGGVWPENISTVLRRHNELFPDRKISRSTAARYMLALRRNRRYRAKNRFNVRMVVTESATAACAVVADELIHRGIGATPLSELKLREFLRQEVGLELTKKDGSDRIELLLKRKYLRRVGDHGWASGSRGRPQWLEMETNASREREFLRLLVAEDQTGLLGRVEKALKLPSPTARGSVGVSDANGVPDDEGGRHALPLVEKIRDALSDPELETEVPVDAPVSDRAAAATSGAREGEDAGRQDFNRGVTAGKSPREAAPSVRRMAERLDDQKRADVARSAGRGKAKSRRSRSEQREEDKQAGPTKTNQER